MHDNFLNLNDVFAHKKHIIAVNKAKKWIKKMGVVLKQDIEKKKWAAFQEKAKGTGIYKIKYNDIQLLGTVNRARYAQIATKKVNEITKELYENLAENREEFSKITENRWGVQDLGE